MVPTQRGAAGATSVPGGLRPAWATSSQGALTTWLPWLPSGCPNHLEAAGSETKLWILRLTVLPNSCQPAAYTSNEIGVGNWRLGTTKKLSWYSFFRSPDNPAVGNAPPWYLDCTILSLPLLGIFIGAALLWNALNLKGCVFEIMLEPKMFLVQSYLIGNDHWTLILVQSNVMFGVGKGDRIWSI